MYLKKCTKTKLFFISLITVFFLFTVCTGCDENDISDEFAHDSNEFTHDTEDEEPIIQFDEEDELTLTVKVFFGDKEAIEADKPDEYEYVSPVYRRIPFTPDIDKAMHKTVESLIEGPKSEEENKVAIISDKAKVLDIKREDNTVIINFSEEVLTDAPTDNSQRGTTFQESIVFTLTQFPTVDNVLVEVEGEPWNQEGRSVWEDPLSRDSF